MVVCSGKSIDNIDSACSEIEGEMCGRDERDEEEETTDEGRGDKLIEYSPNCSQKTQDVSSPPTPKIFRRRWFILILFCLFSLTSAFQWIHLNIIANIVLTYYNDSLPADTLQQETAVDWLSLSYMLVYLPGIIPVMMLLNVTGLRVNNIVGSLFNAVGAWLKVAALGPDRFPLLMFAQVLCAAGDVFVVSIPPRLPAVWFGPNQVSTATSIGVFGNQVGIAVGFLVPPLLVSNSPNITDIGAGLGVMNYSTAAVTTAVFVLILIAFQNEPPVPPSQAQRLAKQSTQTRNYCRSLRNLVTNVHFMLLAISYGILTGAFYAISTLLNGFILAYFPGEEKAVGQIGLTIIFTGIAGAIMAGMWLDKSKAWTSVGIYALSLLGMVAYTVILYCDVGLLWVIFLVTGILGFFMTGYLPVGYEFAAEITYPECEATSSGILTASAMLFGLVLTLGMRAVMNRVSILAANLTLCSAVFIGVILTALVRPDYRRQEAEKQSLEKYDNLKVTVKDVIAYNTGETTRSALLDTVVSS